MAVIGWHYLILATHHTLVGGFGPEYVGANAMGFTTRQLVFLAVTGGLVAAIVLLLSGELIAHLFA
jgi:hypothetical protein